MSCIRIWHAERVAKVSALRDQTDEDFGSVLYFGIHISIGNYAIIISIDFPKTKIKLLHTYKRFF
jgi:hypothetical protein